VPANRTAPVDHRPAIEDRKGLMAQEENSSKFWTPGRIVATAVVVALIATIGYTLFGGHPEEAAASKLVLPGTPVTAAGVTAPADFEVPRIDGGTIKLSDYRGKVVVMDFWATWCPPCRQEVPQLVRIARENRARGVEIIGLHIDDRGRSTPEAIRKFIDGFGINYTVALANDDMFLSYLGSEDDTIPQTLVFDRKGRLVKHLIGYDASEGRALDEAVNRALAGL
jgi:thiol-disulfide isomerase/thioredoxin